MSGFAAFHLTEPLAGELERQGYLESDSYLSEVIPTAARGNNLVAVTPPAALHAVPGLAGAMSALTGRSGGMLLVLVPESALLEWEQVASALAQSSRLAVHTVRTIARASRQILSGGVNVLIATPASALTLLERSTLKTDQVTAVFLAWPEHWADDDAITPLMQDIGRDVQRIIYTSEPNRVADLVERHARRAHTVGPVVAEMPARSEPARSTTPGQVRLVSVPWERRESALREVLDLLDPAASSAWTLTRDSRFIPRLPAGTVHAAREIPGAELIIAYDLPTAAQLAQLAQAAEVVLLVPPAALAWARRIVPAARMLRLTGSADSLQRESAARRETIVRAIASPTTESGLLALAPLFERYDPSLVAAALYHLWRERPEPASPPAVDTTAAAVISPASARIWVGVGKKDGATPNDLVGLITRELGVDRARIGKIEVRELYSLVEFPAAEAEQLAARMNGAQVRRRRVTARIDRGGRARG